MTDPETPTARALLEDPAILGRFPDDVNGIPGRGNLQWLRQHLVAIEAEARRADRPDPRRLVRAVDGMGEDGECPVHTIDGRQYVAKDDVVCVINDQRPAPRPPEPWKPSTVPFEAHEDDSYGQCVVCRVYVPHTDEEYLTEPFPCPTVRLARPPEPRGLSSAGVYGHSYSPDAMAMGDCRICGHVYEDHAPRPPEPDRTLTHALTNDCIGGGCSECEDEAPPEPDRTADGQDVIDAINKAYWAGHDAAKAEPDRTAALVALVAAVDRWNHVHNEVAPARWSRVHDLRAVDEALIAANEAVRSALAATPEPAPVADGRWCRWTDGTHGCVAPKDDVSHKPGPDFTHPFTPEPTPVADGTVCACGHDREWHDESVCDCEGDAEAGLCGCPGFTPTPPTDGAA